MTERNDKIEMSFPLNDPNSKQDICMMVVDMVNSTFFKSQTSAATWSGNLPTAFTDIIDIAVKSYHAKLIKFLGDGFFFVFTRDGGDPEDNCIRAAVKIQEKLEELRSARTLDATMQFRIAAGVVSAWPISVTIGNVPQAQDYLGEEVDAIFRLCSAIAANGIIINAPLHHDVRWNRMAKELQLTLIDGQPTKHLGKISLKGLTPVEAFEVAWTNRFMGLQQARAAISASGADRDPSKPGIDPQRGYTPPASAVGGARVGGAALETTEIGHVYAFNSAGTSCWVQRHSDTQEQLICVFANVVRAGPPDMGEVVCFVGKTGTPHRKAMQVIRSGTNFQGRIVGLDGNFANVKVDEFGARDHSPFKVEIKAAGLSVGQRVSFTLMIEQQDGVFVPIGRNGAVVAA